MKCISEDQIRILEKQDISCADVESLMCDYADGELTPSLKDRVDAHGAACAECRNFMQTYLATISLAANLKPEPMTSEIQNRLRRSLNERLGLTLPMVAQD